MKHQFLQRRLIKLLLLCVAFGIIFSALVSTTKAIPQTFAQFSENDGTQDFVFTNNFFKRDFDLFGGGSATFNTVDNGSFVDFKYFPLIVSGLPQSLRGSQDAHLFLTATTSAPATLDGSVLNQPLNQTFVISIIRDTAAPAGVGTGTRRNLLTATISPLTAIPTLTGTSGNNSAGFSVSTPNHVVTYTSDFLIFSSTNQRNLAVSFSSINLPLAQSAGNFLRSFSAAGSGTFASDPAPLSIGPTAAAVTISGRVLGASGRGVSGVLVNLTEADGTTRTSMTNPFGYYRFLNVSAGQTAILSIISKRYSYTPQVIMVTEDINELNFIAGQ